MTKYGLFSYYTPQKTLHPVTCPSTQRETAEMPDPGVRDTANPFHMQHAVQCMPDVLIITRTSSYYNVFICDEHLSNGVEV